MADGKHLSTKFRELCIADSTISGCVGQQVFYGKYHPVGNTFPQIVFCIEDAGSEYIFPSKHIFLRIWVFVEENAQPSAKTQLELLYKAINDLINRNINTPFDEINIGDNEGLRVVYCNRIDAKDDFRKDDRKYQYEITYKLVVSENEDFDPDAAGNKDWVPCTQ